VDVQYACINWKSEISPWNEFLHWMVIDALALSDILTSVLPVVVWLSD